MTSKRFAMYYHQYHSELIRFTSWLTENRETADDVLQEALCTALRRLEMIPEGVSFRAWMYMNIRFTWMRFRRNSRRDYDSSCRYIRTTSPLQTDDRPDSDQHLRPWKGLVDRAVTNLPEPYRHSIILHEILGMDCAFVSETENTYTGTVKSRLYRGRKLLRQRLMMVAREENFVSWRRRS